MLGSSVLRVCINLGHANKIHFQFLVKSIYNRAAFFHGQVEQPVRGLMSLVNHKDVEVIIAVNERGVFIIDPVECVRRSHSNIILNL